MKVKFIGSADMLSNGVTFTNGGIYDVTDEVAKYLQDNFKNIEVLEETKVIKTEVKAKPAVDTKVAPEQK